MRGNNQWNGGVLIKIFHIANEVVNSALKQRRGGFHLIMIIIRDPDLWYFRVETESGPDWTGPSRNEADDDDIFLRPNWIHNLFVNYGLLVQRDSNEILLMKTLCNVADIIYLYPGGGGRAKGIGAVTVRCAKFSGEMWDKCESITERSVSCGKLRQLDGCLDDVGIGSKNCGGGGGSGGRCE